MQTTNANGAASRVHQRLRAAQTLTTTSLAFALSLLVLLTGCKKETEDTPAPAGSVTADAGPDREVQVGQTATVDGSKSADTQGKPLTFLWTLVRKPAKSAATLEAASAKTVKATFVPDETGEYELELMASNANGQSKDRVVVTATVSQPQSITASINVKTQLTDRIANPDLPDYVVTRDIAVTNELTIDPGVVIAFERDARLDINTNGGLVIAKGEPNKRIRFTGVQKTKGFWAGIMVYSTSNANVFENVDVQYTGSRNLVSATKAGMALFGNAQFAIKGCTFEQSEGYGLLLQEGSVLREFEKNTFRNNGEASIQLSADNVRKLDAASSFTGGNGRNVVEIMSSAIRGTVEHTWTNFTDKTPYRLVNNTLTIDAGLKLLPGVTIEAGRDASIIINSNGYLSAKGTDTDKITFTGAERTAGYWKGMICYSTSTLNVIENGVISYGGSTVMVSGRKTNLAVYGGRSAMVVKNTKVSGSGGYGLVALAGATLNPDVSTVNTFEGNAQDNVQIEK